MRQTRQRQTVMRVFHDAPGPLTVQQAYEAAKNHLPRIGLATVYRVINLLVEQNLLQTSAIPGEAARYEQTRQPHHHFFQCTHCQRVFNIDTCPGDLKRMTPKGFELESHEVILFGRCEDCAKHHKH